MSHHNEAHCEIYDRPRVIGGDPVHIDGEKVTEVRMHPNTPPHNMQPGSISHHMAEEMQRVR
jgi:hypothetical protein